MVKILEEHKVEDAEEKLKKQQIDNEVFSQMKEEDFGKAFDIKKFGTKRQLQHRVE